MSAPEQVMQTYVAMWNATDEGERGRLAEEALTEDAEVIYPTLTAQSRAETVAAIGRFQQQVPGARFVETSGVERHHGRLRATWDMVLPDGTVRLQGEDVAELAPDGRLRLVIGFHNPLPQRS